MALYNFNLYYAWRDAALELGLELKSKDGGCIYMVDPLTDTPIGKEGSADQHFFFMLWTPLNKLRLVFDERKDWQMALDTLKDNIDDFHIEASKYHCDDDSHYAWFPEINEKPSQDITKDDIIKCVNRIRNTQRHGVEQTLATLRS